MAWEPNLNNINDLVTLLERTLNPGEDQRAILDKLEGFNQISDYNNYLAFIFTKLVDPSKINTRQIAGITLKNNMVKFSRQLAPEVQSYVLNSVVGCFDDPNDSIRSTVGTVVASILQVRTLDEWPGLSDKFFEALQSDNQFLLDGVLSCLFKICEDYSSRYSAQQNIPQSLTKFIINLVPNLERFLTVPQEPFRYYSLSSLSLLLQVFPSSINYIFDTFVDKVVLLTEDNTPRIRSKVCVVLNNLVSVHPERVIDKMDLLTRFVITCIQQAGESPISITCCDFFHSTLSNAFGRKVLEQYLSEDSLKNNTSLIPILFDLMIYPESERDSLFEEAMKQNLNLPDRVEDISPELMNRPGRNRGAKESDSDESDDDDDDEDDDDDDDEDQLFKDDPPSWTTRKAAASVLDYMASIYRENLVPSIIKVLGPRLESPEWFIREAAILALGAICNGCRDGLIQNAQYIQNIGTYLLNSARSDNPMIRTITTWALSRYAKILSSDFPAMQLILQALIGLIVDPNKQVQISGCSAITSILEDDELTDETKHAFFVLLEPLITNLGRALQTHQAKSLMVLYDCLGTVADVLGDNIRSNAFAPFEAQIAKVLTEHWLAASIDSLGIGVLAETLAAIVSTFGMTISQMLLVIYNKATELLESWIIVQAAAMSPFEEPDHDIVINLVDLLSSMCDGIKNDVESLVGQSKSIELVCELMKSRKPEVRQCAFALIGDLSKYAWVHVENQLSTVLGLLAGAVTPPINTASVNNALWAMSELLLHSTSPSSSEQVSRVLQFLLERLSQVMSSQSINRGILENAAICIGRLHNLFPVEMSRALEHFFVGWAAATSSHIRDMSEKEKTSLSICDAVYRNPQAILSCFSSFCVLVYSWSPNIPTELNQRFSVILHQFRGFSPDAWEPFKSRLDPSITHFFAQQYNI